MLTDLEICTKIAEITNTKVLAVGNNLFLRSQLSKLYDPLDDALNHQLMIKDGINLNLCLLSGMIDYWLEGTRHVYECSYNKAVLLAIIEKHK